MKRKKVKKLAKDHWEFLEELLKLNFVSTCSIAVTGYLYKQAFIHGYKHGYKHGKEEKYWDIKKYKVLPVPDIDYFGNSMKEKEEEKC